MTSTLYRFTWRTNRHSALFLRVKKWKKRISQFASRRTRYGSFLRLGPLASSDTSTGDDFGRRDISLQRHLLTIGFKSLDEGPAWGGISCPVRPRIPSHIHRDLVHTDCIETTRHFTEDLIDMNVCRHVNISFSQCTQDAAGTASIRSNIAILDTRCPFRLRLKVTYSALRRSASLVECKPQFNVQSFFVIFDYWRLGLHSENR